MAIQTKQIFSVFEETHLGQPTPEEFAYWLQFLASGGTSDEMRDELLTPINTN